MGTYYNRLTEVADLNYDDSAEEAAYAQVVDQLQRCRDLAASFRADPGMQGQTAAAALAWLSEYDATLEAKATELDTMHTRQQLARQAMATARQEHASLSPRLVSAYETSYIVHSGPFTLSDGTEISGGAYLSRLQHERDLERDRKARQILDTMNAAVNEQVAKINERVPVKDDVPDDSGSDAGSRSTGSRSAGSKTPTVAASPHSTVPTVLMPTKPTPVPTVPTHPSVPGVPGSSTPSPITTTPITVVDGPVTGTYTPPSVLNADDPAWSSTYRPVTSGNDAAMMVGGVLGMGASVVAARALGAGMSGQAALAFQTAAGSGSASALNGSSAAGVARAPGGGLLSSPASRAAAAEAEGAGGASSGRTSGGMLSRSSASGTASGRQPVRGTTEGMGADGRTGKGKRRERPRLVGYDVDRLEGDPVPAELDHPALTAGTAADLAPLDGADDGDRW